MQAIQPVNKPRSPFPRRRAGFTLLELVLAMGIGVLLLVGLYVTMNIMLGTMQLGRTVVQQSQVARGVLNRINSDISHNLGPISPYTVTALNNYQNGGAASTTTSGTTTASATTGTTGSTGTSSSTAATPAASGGLGPVNFNLMVQGTTDTMALYVSMLPRDITNGQDSNDPSVIQAPDLRRIAYWVIDGQGLARQEIKAATATDQLNAMPPDVTDSTTYSIIAPEVTNVQFAYFDGSNWQDTWDGTQLSSDGVSPQGPPSAIAITLTVARGEGKDENANTQTYRHVVLIPAANNLNPDALQTMTNNATNAQATTGNNP